MHNPNSITTTRIPNTFALVSNKSGISNVISKNGSPFIIGVNSGNQYNIEIFRSCLTPGDNGSENENTTAPSRNTSHLSMSASFILEHEFWTDYLVIYKASEFDPNINNCSIYVVNKNNILDYTASLGSTASNLEEAYLYLHSDNGLLCLNCNYPDIFISNLVLFIDFGYFPSYPMYGNIVYNLASLSGTKQLNIVNGTYIGYGPGSKIHGGSIKFNSGFAYCDYDDGLNTHSFTIDILLGLSYIDQNTIIIWNKENSSNNGYVITGNEINIYDGTEFKTYTHGLYTSTPINGYINVVFKYNNTTKNLIVLINNSQVLNETSVFYSPNSISSYFIGKNPSGHAYDLAIVSIKLYDTFLDSDVTSYNYNNMLHRYQYL